VRRCALDEETKDHKLRLLAIYQDNLRELIEQAARFGQNPPLNIINEIKFHRKNIQDIRLQLELNAQEVPFDKLLVGIEDLRKFAEEEAKRVLRAYNEIHYEDPSLGQGLIGVFAAGVFLSMGVDYLYLKYIKHQGFDSQRDIVSILIYVVGVFVGSYFTYRIGKWIVNNQRKDLVYKVGYDPLDRKKN
jgi:hypothetical protein